MTMSDEAELEVLKEGGTAEYVNDDPASGVVVFRNKKGEPVAYMNAEDYAKLINRKLIDPC
jgi:hypothetical protein